MFLLIPSKPGEKALYPSRFTFHNVSINTNIFGVLYDDEATLHSTMFLLIQNTLGQMKLTVTTLHSTMFLLIRCLVLHNRPVPGTLHSTMFLLILRFRKDRA